MKYIEFIQNIVYAPSSIKVVFKGSENTTMIGKYHTYIAIQCFLFFVLFCPKQPQESRSIRIFGSVLGGETSYSRIKKTDISDPVF